MKYRAEPTQKEKDRLFYNKTLRGEECICGRYKHHGFAFCYRCYVKLPPDLKAVLYRRLGEGFEDAFNAAAAYLGD